MGLFDRTLEDASLAAEAIHTSRSAVPQTTEDYDEKKKGSFIARRIEGFRSQLRRGLPVTSGPIETLSALLDAVETQSKETDGLDDRKKALEYGLTLLSRLPEDNFSSKLEQKAISLLYRDLPHPPSTQMGAKYQFRSADGSGNSPSDAELGKAFSPYSRSCTSTRTLPVNELPDPGLVFDCLIKRDKFVPHPAGLSGFFFNFATTVIHSVFRTSRVDWNINETSSYVDLGLLYGNTQAHQDFIRHKDGRGRLLPDVFAETRLLNLPPGVSSIIVIFNRNHNYIADMLLRINERGKWTRDLSKLSEDDKLQQDEEIFQTARLINAGSYANVVLSDYLSGILGTVRDGSTWTLDIASERREPDRTLLERGRGNSCSVEFNVLYRLHPAMSAEDAAYTEKAFQYLFGTADFDDIAPEQFELVIGQKIAQANSARFKDKDGKPIPVPDIQELSAKETKELINDGKPADYLLPQYNIPTFKRDPKTKRYDDDQLANAILNAIGVPAASFRARGVPGVMRVIEVLGITQARDWGCCTLNEFRRFLGLRPYATFEEWNPDPEIAECARKLYRTPENLELYVGLVAEESKPVGDGAGLCPSYTMSRAILADAVALVRGDRYLTYDFTPFNLTAWGFTEANRNIENAAFGGVLGRLIARGLPNHFNDSSVWTHFPLMTPTGQPYSMDKVLTRLGLINDYSIEKPNKRPGTQVVDTSVAVLSILGDSTQENKFITPYLQNIKDVTLDPSFLSHIDGRSAFDAAREQIRNVFVPKDSLDATGKWFFEKTLELVKGKSQAFIGNRKRYVDVVKDVFRLIPVHWVSIVVAGLPLKTKEEPRGIYYEQEMYQFLKEIYTFIFFEADTSLKIPNRREAKENVQRLRRFVNYSLAEAKGGPNSTIVGTLGQIFLSEQNQKGNPILTRSLSLRGPPKKADRTDTVANEIIAVISTASVELSQIFTHVVNFYLAPNKPNLFASVEAQDAYKRAVELQARIVDIAVSDSPDSTALLEGYAREALRLDPVIDGFYRIATEDGTIGPVSFKRGECLYFDVRKIGRDEKLFTNPNEIDPNRRIDKYSILYGDGVFKALGEEFVWKVTGQVFKAVISLIHVKRAKGPAGSLRRFEVPQHNPEDEVTSIQRSKEVKEGIFEDYYEYDVTPVNFDHPFRFSYLDVENNHRLTTWATGLSLEYEL